MRKLVALLLIMSFASFACYSTYSISMDQLKELQADGNKVVNSVDGDPIEVTSDTRLFVRDDTGKKYPITPYNFKVTGSQLVASDRDYIFMLDQISDKGEIELLSTFKTVGLITLGAGAAVGLIVVIAATAGTKSAE